MNVYIVSMKYNCGWDELVFNGKTHHVDPREVVDVFSSLEKAVGAIRVFYVKLTGEMLSDEVVVNVALHGKQVEGVYIPFDIDEREVS